MIKILCATEKFRHFAIIGSSVNVMCSCSSLGIDASTPIKRALNQVIREDTLKMFCCEERSSGWNIMAEWNFFAQK
ncbi:MAG: hypothetical protein JWR50_1146 [Mucilaginibacter sp.]|nr:hypothetical protein [Mucilaginibacter sp.]